ncbi:MFS transporter, partial [Enterovirga sp.]|uniref:MFS transporter n=1 Tax=Enterovirga sp. TaxID=2026350 RepID=UPI002619EF4F
MQDGVAELLFATMFPHAIVSMISLAPPIMAAAVVATYGFSPELTGLYTGLVFLFALLTTLVSAPLINRFGPLRLTAVCLVLAGIGMAVFGAAGIPGLLVGGMVIGLAYGPMTPASSHAISSHAQSPRFSLIVSIRQTSIPIGGVLAGLCVPALVVRIGWSGACLVLAGAAGISALVFYLLSPALRRERPARRVAGRLNVLQPIRFVLSHRTLLTLSCASTMFAAVQLVASSFLVIYLVTAVGHDLVTAGALMSASQAAGILGRPLWGHVADRVHSGRNLLCYLGFGMAASCLLMAGLTTLGAGWASLPVAVLLGGTAGAWNGVYLAEVMRGLEPEHVGPAISGSLIFTYLGIAFGPPVFGALARAVDFAPAFVILAVLVSVTAGLLLLVGRTPRP